MSPNDVSERTPSSLDKKLGWALVLILLAGCLLVMRPFVSAFLWALVLCSSSWPLYGRLVRGLRGRRALAAFIMCMGVVFTLLLPLAIVGNTLSDNVDSLTGATRRWMEAGPPQPPEWLGKVPLVGAKAVASWQSLAGDTGKLMERFKAMLPVISEWLLRGGLMLGQGMLQLALSTLIAFFLFRDGEHLARRLNKIIERIGGERGLRLLSVARKTIRGVVYGILGTALVQAALAGIGLLVAGVPGVALLSLLTFFLSVVPMGTALILLPSALWLFHEDQTGWGIFMLVWALIVGNVDNVIKPWLISQGSDMPFILIFIGVIGGAFAFGFIGVFLGPTLLAVGYRIMEEWSPREPAVEASSGGVG